MELSTYSLSLCIIIIILSFFSYQLRDKNFILDPVEPLDLKNIEDINHIDKEKCRVIYEGDICRDCGGSSYRKVEVSNPSLVNGIHLEPGSYCIRNNLPPCTHGIIVVDSTNQYNCICSDPTRFNGVSCSTEVACKTTYGVDGQLKDGVCVCPEKTPNGFKMIEMGETECVVDPCLFPIPYPESKGFSEGKCDCGKDILRNELSEYSKCSSCIYEKNGNVHTVPINCFNESYLIDTIRNLYPCFSVENPSYCGTAKITVKDKIDLDKEGRPI